MTRIPFQPQHHAQLPDSTLVGVLCAADPVLPRIATPHGAIEVRRLIGIDALELDRVETWSPRGFIEELGRRDPLLLSPIARRSWMDDVQFLAAVERRAADEGSEMDSAMFDVAWSMSEDRVVIELPHGRGAERLREALCGRIGFGRRLGALSRTSPMIAFEPQQHGIKVFRDALMIGGDLDSPTLRALLAAIDAGERHLIVETR